MKALVKSMLLNRLFCTVRGKLVTTTSRQRVTSPISTRPTSQMNSLAPIRFAIAAAVTLSTSLMAQSPMAQSPVASQSKPSTPTPAVSSTLPATQPTTPEPPTVPLTPAQRPPRPAQVTFADGMLSISAENSSLNQILRQIASDTGLKITGGVRDERVFGQYGPAAPAEILSELLDGTGSNMILVQGDNDTLAELILTPRQGGPTPPNPNAAAFAQRREAEDAPEAAQPAPPPAPVIQPVTPPVTPASTATSPANPSQPESPNGVKTPQQIYEQLQRLRSQQQQQQQQTTPQ